jgi:MprA protease rhombosortase-interaction domain-containing protein
MVAAEVHAARRQRTSLTVASGVLGLSTVATRLAILVVMALLTRGAGTASAGYYGLATLTAQFTAAALSLGFPTYLTRDVAAGQVSPAEVARIHWARLGGLMMAAGVAFPLATGLLPDEIGLGFFLFFGASLLEQWNDTAWVLVRGTRSAWTEALTNGCTGALLVTACAIDAWLRGGLSFPDAAVLFVVAAALRSTAACILVGVWRLSPASAEIPLPVHVRLALPYFASDLLGLMYFRGDVFVLALFVAASQVGEYVSATTIVGPAVQVAASMGTGALAYAAQRAFTGGRAGDQRTILEFFGISGQAAAGLMCLGLPVAVAILFGGNGRPILLLALILALFLAMRFANFGLSAILLARGRASSRLLVLLFSIAGNVALNLGLDGRFGAYGAAWATVLTELIVMGSLLWFIADRALTRAAAVKTASVAVVAIVMIGLLQTLGPGQVAPITGVLLLTAGLVGFLVQRWAPRRDDVPAGAEGT